MLYSPLPDLHNFPGWVDKDCFVTVSVTSQHYHHTFPVQSIYGGKQFEVRDVGVAVGEKYLNWHGNWKTREMNTSGRKTNNTFETSWCERVVVSSPTPPKIDNNKKNLLAE